MSSRREAGRGRSCENVSLYPETAKEGQDQTQNVTGSPWLLWRKWTQGGKAGTGETRKEDTTNIC